MLSEDAHSIPGGAVVQAKHACGKAVWTGRGRLAYDSPSLRARAVGYAVDANIGAFGDNSRRPRGGDPKLSLPGGGHARDATCRSDAYILSGRLDSREVPSATTPTLSDQRMRPPARLILPLAFTPMPVPPLAFDADATDAYE